MGVINQLHALLHRPEKGWDPVPKKHAFQYAEMEWSGGVSEELLDELEKWLGGFAGKRVLDLGGGPGQYSLAFSKRGAHVTWHDISATYREFAEKKAQEAGASICFSLGYMDDAAKQLETQFDLVFNRICWYYCKSDSAFAKVLYSLIKPGGVGYVDTTHSGWERGSLSSAALTRTLLNDQLNIKIGHPYPPRGRLARLFSEMPIETMLIDYRVPTNDRILMQRAWGSR
jgi:2-polyprenyl-3-methyl-5-hydroxy-6-metoxy-1,4-benzoquinol methylase